MKYKKIHAFLLSFVLLVSLVTPTFAAAPTPTFDETLYLTLDPYGAYRSGSVVKSYSLNGQTELTDYGTYSKVSNLSDYTKAELQEGAVQFHFDQTSPKRFYFEGTFRTPPANLPWNVDVSYKCNGVPSTADCLAGTTGVVQIDIDMIPNPNASDYYRNNFILQVGTMVNLDDVLSVSAPGAQIQTIGSMQAILFMAMPGEERHFSLSIGSNDFSFDGLAILMVPATLAQLDEIADLRQAKEDAETSANAINQSLDAVLDTLSSMQQGLLSSASGLDALNAARASIAQGKAAVYDGANQSLSDLGTIHDTMTPTAANIANAQTALNSVKTQMSVMVETTKGLKGQLSETRDVVAAMQKNVLQLCDLIDDMERFNERGLDLSNEFNQSLEAFGKRMTTLTKSLVDLKDTLNKVPELRNIGLLPINPTAPPEDQKLAGTINYLITDANQTITQISKLLEKVSQDTSDVVYDLSDVCSLLGNKDLSLTNELIRLSSLLKDYLRCVDEKSGTADSLFKQVNQMGDVAVETTKQADTLIGELDALDAILNTYEPQAQQALTDMTALSDAAATGLANTKTFLTQAKDFLQDSGVKLDGGTEQTLDGLSGLMRDSASGLNQTAVLRSSKDTLKNLLEDKWNQYTGEETTILNMDSTAPMQSFTSPQNAAPNTLQVVMRTEEITASDIENDTTQNEDFKAEGSILSRLGSVFQKIADALTGK